MGTERDLMKAVARREEHVKALRTHVSGAPMDTVGELIENMTNAAFGLLLDNEVLESKRTAPSKIARSIGSYFLNLSPHLHEIQDTGRDISEISDARKVSRERKKLPYERDLVTSWHTILGLQVSLRGGEKLEEAVDIHKLSTEQIDALLPHMQMFTAQCQELLPIGLGFQGIGRKMWNFQQLLEKEKAARNGGIA